jgi:hypothetical protein
MFKKILWFLLVVLIVLQFIHPARNISKGEQPNSIAKAYAIPGNVNAILVKACNDCHSNNTRYRWYFRLQPLDWWLNNHIKEGKKHLNFDEYTNRSPRYQYNKLEEVIEEVKDNHMPINSYTWTHKDAILTDQEKEILFNWVEGIRDEMKAKYPIDSLLRKRQ